MANIPYDGDAASESATKVAPPPTVNPNHTKRKAKKRVTKEGGVPKSEHNVFTHNPMSNTCAVCLASKIQKASRVNSKHAIKRVDALPEAEIFGDRLTADHAVLNKENKSAEEENLYACVIQDGATDWLQSYPCKTKNAKDTLKCFQKFLGPHIKAKHVYTDNSKEFAAALDAMCVCHDTCTPYTPATN